MLVKNIKYQISNIKLSSILGKTYCMKKALVSCALFLVPLIIFSQQSISALIDQKARAVQSKLVEWRRYLHQHPELSNREYNTSEYVTAHLKALGLEVQTVAKTGIVAI